MHYYNYRKIGISAHNSDVNPCTIVKMEEEFKKFVSQQIEAIDRMLFNCYGTTYKIAAKYLVQKTCMIWLNEIDELMLVKLLVTNLWSILDYCCILYFAKHINRRPNPVEARNISVPITFQKKKQKRKEAGLCDILFKDLQYTVQNSKTETFYRLHFLRNALTHRTVVITDRDREDSFPDILQGLTLEAEYKMRVLVPKQPWSDESCENRSNYASLPLLNVLMAACELVKERRDMILMQEFGVGPFAEEFKFNLNQKDLQVTLSRQPEPAAKRCTHLHFHCYGLEAEYNKQIQEIYNKP